MEVVGSIAGGLFASDAADSAADAQVQASREATKAQREMFDKQVELQQPWRDAGGASLNRLMHELGLSRTPVYRQGGGAPRTEAQIREQLRSQFMTGGAAPAGGGQPGGGIPADGSWTMDRILQAKGLPPQQAAQQMFLGVDANGDAKLMPMGGGTFDSAGFEAAVARELERERALQSAEGANDYGGSEYGGLLRDFSAQDLYDDPSYQFRMDEGLKARTRAYAGRGSFLSGAALKGIERYGQDYASTEYGKAFDRDNVNKTNKFNRLASIAGIGQTAANQTGAAAANFGSQSGSNIIGAGNATAAGRVGSANAISDGLSGAWSAYQQNELMRQMQAPGGYRYKMPDYSGAEY
jgi:hypothetical protein